MTPHHPASPSVRAALQARRASLPAMALPLFLACGLPSGGLAAADYPVKPIRIIMPNSAGAATDTVARILAAKLTDVTGQQIIIDNRPGGGGVIGMEAVKNAAPDGYTLAQCGISQAIRP